LIKLYWDIGKTIVEKQQKEGWGKMSIDLRNSFPRMAGLSPRNLLYMRQFVEAYHDLEITQQVAAQIIWG